MRRTAVWAIASVVAMISVARSSSASVLQFSNGTFATNGGAGQLTVNTTLGSWTAGGKEGNFGSPTTPPVFVFPNGSLQTGATGDAFMGTVAFYGASNAPNAGVVVAADGDPSYAGSLSQTVSGLAAGTTYTLTFNWAGAQTQGYSGPTTENWKVAFGAATLSTPTVNTPSQSFVGWQSASMNFTATSASQLLTFTATGAPAGQEPWLLLNNVALAPAPTPEPASLSLIGLGAAGVLVRRRRRA